MGILILIYIVVIAALSALFIFLIGEKYFGSLAGMNMKVVRLGMIFIVLSLSFFLFFPVVLKGTSLTVSYDKLISIATEYMNYLSERHAALNPEVSHAEKEQSAVPASLENIDEELHPDAARLLNIPFASMSGGGFEAFMLTVGIILMTVMTVLTFLLIIFSRQLPEKPQEEDDRKHLFEYTPFLGRIQNKR